MTITEPGPPQILIDCLIADTLGPTLDLSYQSFDDLARFELLTSALGNSRQIFVLHLARCPLSIDHSALLAKSLATNRSIQILDLSGCGLRDDAIAELTPSFIKMPFLIRLSLQHNEIEEAGAAMIGSVITSNQSLRSIQLSGNPFLNNADGLNNVIGALQSRPDLLNDCIWSYAKVKPALDAAEKKFQNLPIRMRYSAMKQIHVQWFQCVKSGSVVQLNKFLKGVGRDIDPAVMHPEGFNAVHLAAANGHSKILKELLKLGVPATTRTLTSLGGDSQWFGLVNAAGSLIHFALPRRSTPIFFAVAADDPATVKVLIQAGEKAQEPNAAGLWPHDYATTKCESEIPAVDKEKASKTESDRIAKLVSKGGGKKKPKKK